MSLGVTIAAMLAFGTWACSGNVGSPASPSAATSGSTPVLAASPFGGNAMALVEVANSSPAGGAGIVNVTQTATPDTNNFEVEVAVHGGPADEDLYVQISTDAGLGAAQADGTCNRASQPGFPNPPTHAGGDAGIFHTSAGGSGSTHIKFVLAEGVAAGAFDQGARVDIMYRVVNVSKSFELRTSCFQLLGK
jgi:hypothetical protein